MRVPKDQLGEMVKAGNSLPIRGYSVTIPHKESAATLPGQKDQLVALTHAANTLLMGENGWRSLRSPRLHPVCSHGLTRSSRISSVCWPCSGAGSRATEVSSICTGLATRSNSSLPIVTLLR